MSDRAFSGFSIALSRPAPSLVTALLLAAVSVVAQPPEPSSADFTGRTITAVSFDPVQQPFDSGEIASMFTVKEGLTLQEGLTLKAGSPYSAAAVRAAIERLYATGRYADIQADAEPAPGGVAVRFLTKPAWFVGTVTTEGDSPDPPSEGQIVNAARLDLGTPFDESKIPAAVDSIRKLLFDNGYFGATVEPKLSYESVYNQVNIAFSIHAGKRAHYEAPSILGDTSVLSAQAIAKASGYHRWWILPGYHPIAQNTTRRGIEKIRLKYENSHHLEATVVLKDIMPEADGRLGRPDITVTPGPPVDVKVEGAHISRGRMKQELPLYQEHAIDPDLLAEGSTDLRSYFQAQGYFDVEVEFHRRVAAGGITEISYAVETGARHRLVHIEIAGNHYFNQQTIRERMFLQPASFAQRRGQYSEAFRHRDEESIAALYQANGFADVKVTSRTADDYRGKKGDLAVYFNIDEGAQYRVASLTLKGVMRTELSVTVNTLSSQTGQVYSEANIGSDRETLIRAYGELGYSEATFLWTSKPGPAPHTMAVQFDIDEGPREVVRNIIISGLSNTHYSLVQKQIRINPGDPLSPTAMADAQRRLYDLGIFAQVNMAIQNPDGEEEKRNIIYDLGEARRWSITTGAGLEFARIGGGNAVADLSDPGGAPGVSPRVLFDITRLNLFGTTQSLTLSTRLSTLQRKAVLTWSVPHIFNQRKFDASYSILYDDTHDVRTFESKREEASAQIVHHVTKPITLFYRFTYRHVGVSNLKIDPLLVPQLAQSVRVGLATISFVQDRRDDPTDAHKGIYNTVDVGLASQAFGSQTSFVRVLARNATYTRIGSKLVFARETQFGMTPAFHVPAGSDPTDPIPLAERFFGGGGNELRGYPDNQAGPRDPLTGFPLGGSALLFNNTELRFPLYGPNINGVIFEDAGNVYQTLGAISFRADQHGPGDFDYMSHAVGFGIRYRTPLGPIRVDLAWSINPPHYVGYSGTYAQLVQCSAANNCQTGLQQISHFQFFFSIGQAF